MQFGALAGLLGLKEKCKIQLKCGVSSLTVMDQPLFLSFEGQKGP